MASAFCQSCGQPIDPASRFCNQCGQPQPGPSSAPAMPVSTASPAAWSASTAAVASPAPVAVQYAGFWIRFIAALLDSLIVSLVTGPLISVVQLVTGLHNGLLWGLGASGAESGPRLAMVASTLALMITISVAVHALYEAWLTSSSKQATVGKMVFRVKVTDAALRRISFARALGRYFAKYLSSLTLMIGYIMAGFTERKQALHDFVAGTLVIREVGPPYAIVPQQPQA